MNNHLKLLTNKQMYQLDKQTIESGISGEKLMTNAGTAIAEEIINRFKKCKTIVLCGPGNNGGDGFVIANFLQEKGWEVKVALVGDIENLTGDAAIMAKKYSGEVIKLSPEAITDQKLIIDAIFGAGLTRQIEGEIYDTIKKINDLSLDLVSVDIPSGIDGDTGNILGIATEAKTTITFSTKKPGHLLLPGKKFCGEVIVKDIGHPQKLITNIDSKYFENAPALWIDDFPWPNQEKHKYKRGHAAIIGGDEKMTGAARLSAVAALRTNAGLATVICPSSALGIYAKALTAVMTKTADNITELKDAISDKDSVIIGPGAGVDSKTKEFVLAILEEQKSCVIDADAISSFKDDPEELFNAIKKSSSPVIMTPHEGEFKRIFGDIESNKLEAVKNAAEKSGAVIILKGSDTIICNHNGNLTINNNAPPTLATAGSGDVLAGIVGGLLADKMDAFKAASTAVWIHGEAANIFGVGLIAEDLTDLIPKVLSELKTNLAS